MKWLSYLAGGFFVAFWVPAQAATQSPAATNNAQAQAIELLRRVIAEQQQNPGKIIRSPTNASPRLTPPTTGAPPAAATVPPRPTRAELEKQFLDGKISAKQYQRAISELEKNPPPAIVTTVRPEPKPVVAAPITPKPVPSEKPSTPAPVVSPRTATAAAPPARNTQAPPVPNAAPTATTDADEDALEQKTLTDVEAKIDEILARRAAIQEAARTNNAAATNSLAAGPLTKRQKLDALLRELIQGKITEKDYNTRRDQVLGEPD